MQSLKLKITLLSPVLLSSNVGDPNMVGTFKYIPARSMRGLFASEYIKKNSLVDAHKEERFYRWFLKGEIKFTDAFILSEKNNRLIINYPIPFSVQKEKNGVKIYDLLFEDTEEQTISAGEFGILKEKYLCVKEVKTSLNFHHSRDREKGSAKEGYIFNYEALEPFQCFGGYIIGSDETIKEFQNIFQSGIYYLGRSRNSQYGKAYIDLNSFFEDPTDLQHEVSKSKDSVVSLTFLSDVILYNEYGFPCTDINILEKTFGCNIEKSFIKTSEVETFVSVWRLRTPSEISFKAGSTFFLRINNEFGLERLYELQEKGIGERKEEGFGRFIIGFQSEGELSILRNNEKELTKPSEPIPHKVKEIVESAIKERFLMLLKAEAIKLVSETKNGGITPSIIGRLLLMLKSAESIFRFQDNIKNLRKLAKDKLEDLRVGNKLSLYYFLLNQELIKEYLRHANLIAMENILSETGLQNPIENPQFLEKCHREFLETFLTFLQKEAKKK